MAEVSEYQQNPDNGGTTKFAEKDLLHSVMFGFVENHPRDTEVRLSYERSTDPKDDQVQVVIHDPLMGELPLNRMLLEGFTIRHKSGEFSMNHQDKVICIDLDIFEKNPKLAKAVLSHEIGHSFGGRYQYKRESTIDAKEPDPLKRVVTRSFEKLIIEINTKFYNEVAAWDHGTSFAHLLGLDEIEYEDLMQEAIETYFFGGLATIHIFLKSRVDRISENYAFTIYNPITRKDSHFNNVQELMEYLENLNAENKFEKSAGKVEKRHDLTLKN